MHTHRSSILIPQTPECFDQRVTPVFRLTSLLTKILLCAACVLLCSIGAAAQDANTFFIDLNTTLNNGGAQTQGFTVTGTKTFVLRFAADFNAEAAVISGSTAQSFLDGGSYTFFGSNFVNTFGTTTITLGAGSYAVGIRNRTSVSNRMRAELDFQLTVPNWNYYDSPFSRAEIIPANSKAWRGFTVQSGVRYFIDGCNSGLDTYIIPESQLANFQGTGGFQYYYGSDDDGANPGLWELNLSPGVYYLVFRNRNATGKAVTYVLDRFITGSTPPPPPTPTPTPIPTPTPTPLNSIDEAGYFVTQQYGDFLNRAPDAPGLNFWMTEITSCGSNSSCINVKRINTSAAFFISIEFQQTGYLVERLYKAAYNDATGTSTLGGAHQIVVPIVRLNEFLPDTQEIGLGVIVNQTGWEAKLESNKVAFTQKFVQRTRFTSAYPTTMTPTQFVDKLFLNAGLAPSAADRTAAINVFGAATTTTDVTLRARALRLVAENSTFSQREFNRAFVLMQFFGYLRRNPNDSPDSDYSGYDFWLSKLNEFNGNYQDSEMVKAFITSTEYRHRFGP